jgi:hypothetical protein
MALKYADRVKEGGTVVGTGSAILTGASAGYRTFASQLLNNDTCYYSIVDPNTNEWEIGIGTYIDANILARTSILSSSNSNNIISFGAGVKDVFITFPSAAIVAKAFESQVALLSGATFTGPCFVPDLSFRAVSIVATQLGASIANYTVLGTDFLIEVNSLFTYSLVMPAPAASSGRVLIIRTTSTDAVNTTVLITLEDGTGSTQLIGNYRKGESVTMRCDGVSWYVISRSEHYSRTTVTLTYTGTAGPVTRSCDIYKRGSIVNFELPAASGVSNATTFTITGIPLELRPLSGIGIVCRVLDNNTWSTGGIDIYTNGTIQPYRSDFTGAFTVGGQKGVGITHVTYVS